MRCLKDKTLRAYFDGELPEKKEKAVGCHLKVCESCRARMTEVKKNRDFTVSTLELLNPAEIPRAAPVLRFDLGSGPSVLKRIFTARVRIPAVLLAVLLFVCVFLTVELMARNRPEAGESGQVLYFRTAGEIKVIPLNQKAERFEPIKNPRIFVYREKN